MNIVKKDSVDVTRYVMLVDSATGAPETGYTITNLDLQYTRNQDSPAVKVDATALAAINSAHGDNKAFEVDSTSSPGLYRIDWPDAAFATGVDKVILVVSGTGLHPAVEEIQLVDIDVEDSVRAGLTSLPNAAADAAGGLVISDAGGLDVDAVAAAIATILTDYATDADVSAVIDALTTDANAELAALPGATPTMLEMLQFVYQYFRHKKTATATQEKLFKLDDTTVLGTAGLSDDGTTFAKTEMS